MKSLNIAIKIAEKIQNAGYICYFAGGWVRDHLMQHPSDDIDLVTDASVEQLQKLFPKTIPVGISFGIIIIVEEGFQFEVATFRQEDEYEDGRRPSTVTKASPQEDAQRRDFTINGLFYDPMTKEIFDYVNGQKDIDAQIIRAIGDPKKRFSEDRLRMIRAVRYSARFHFTIEKDTLHAIKELASYLFPSVSIERIYNEFEKMSRFPNFDRALLQLFKLSLLQEIFPSLKGLSEKEIRHRLTHLKDFPSSAPLILQLMELFPLDSLNEKEAICKYLKTSNEERSLVLFQHACDQKLSQHIEKITDYDWAHLYAKPQFAICFSIFAAKLPEDKKEAFEETHRNHQQALERYIAKIHRNELIVSAKDFIAKGIKPGKQLGELIKQANEIAINEKIDDPQVIISKLL